VAVAVLGQLGSERIYTLLDGTVSNNLVSIQKTDSEPKGLLHRPRQQLHGLIPRRSVTHEHDDIGITGSPSSICMRSVTLPRSIRLTSSPASAQALAAWLE
jgi:hypothetical protein